MNRETVGSYVVLLILCYLCMDHVVLQRLFTLCWLALNLALWVRAQSRQSISFAYFVYMVACSQLPGIISAAASLYMDLKGQVNEWANGILELWYYPFLSLFELLPPGRVGSLSDTYIATCALPFILILLSVVCWRTGRALSARFAKT